MANVLINENSMTAIANAIRTKKGVSTKYKPADMADAISSITTGGITPTGTKSITANGTYDVTDFASAEVNVPTSGTTPTGTKEITITENGTTTEDVSAYANAQITVNVQGGGGISIDGLATNSEPSGSISISATNVVAYAFYNRTGITSVSMPNTTTIGSYAFQGCSNLVSVDAKELTGVSNPNNWLWVFRQCTKLKNIALPKARSVPNGTFYGCSQLEAVDFTNASDLNQECFRNCTTLNTVVLRKTSAITTLGLDIFKNTPFASGGSGGTLYVPQAMVSSYEADTNWSTILGYENNQILPIEGSVYETQYVDGTPISA